MSACNSKAVVFKALLSVTGSQRIPTYNGTQSLNLLTRRTINHHHRFFLLFVCCCKSCIRIHIVRYSAFSILFYDQISMFEIQMTREVDEKLIQVWCPEITIDDDGDDDDQFSESEIHPRVEVKKEPIELENQDILDHLMSDEMDYVNSISITDCDESDASPLDDDLIVKHTGKEKIDRKMAKIGVKSHTKVSHTEETPAKKFTCNFCSFKSKNRQKHEKHMLSHEGQLKSNEYGNQSNGKANRRNNTKTQKDNESNLKDNLQSPLQRHGKSNKCLECDYKCKTKGHLRSHMLTHNKDPSEVELLKSHDSDQFQRKAQQRKSEDKSTGTRYFQYHGILNPQHSPPGLLTTLEPLVKTPTVPIDNPIQIVLDKQLLSTGSITQSGSPEDSSNSNSEDSSSGHCDQVPSKTPCKPSKRYVKEERKIRKRENDKNAAQRFRMKERVKIEMMLAEEKILLDRSTYLGNQIAELQFKIKNLKCLLRGILKTRKIKSTTLEPLVNTPKITVDLQNNPIRTVPEKQVQSTGSINPPGSPEGSSSSSGDSSIGDPEWVSEVSPKTSRKRSKRYSKKQEKKIRKSECEKSAATTYRTKTRVKFEMILAEEKILLNRSTDLGNQIRQVQYKIKNIKGLLRDILKAK